MIWEAKLSMAWTLCSMFCCMLVKEERRFGTSDVIRATPFWICGKAPMTVSILCSIFETFMLLSLNEAAVDFVRFIKSEVRLKCASDVSLDEPSLG